jgi:hypothetical protein
VRGYRKLDDGEVYNFCCQIDIIRLTKSKRMTGGACRMHVQEIGVYNVLTENLAKEIQFVILSCRWV